LLHGPEVAGHPGTGDDENFARERSRTRRVPVVRWAEASGVPTVARTEEIVALELEAVPFDLNVVAHAAEMVPCGRAGVASALRIFLLGLVPRRT
jgi:hypothetical protein